MVSSTPLQRIASIFGPPLVMRWRLVKQKLSTYILSTKHAFLQGNTISLFHFVAPTKVGE